MVLNAKVIARSTAKISLNDRFTELRKISPPIPPPPPPKPERTALYYEPRPVVRPRYEQPYRPLSQPAYDSPSDSDYYDPPPPPPTRYTPVGRNWSLAERVAEGMYLPKRRLAMEAAFKLKQKSLKQRVGSFYSGGFRGRPQVNSFWSSDRPYREFRPRYNFRYNGGGRGRGNNLRRARSFQNLGDRMWGSTNSLASDGTGFRRRSYSGSSGRGFRGRGRGRGGMFRSVSRDQISRDELDRQLDEYMTGAKNVIAVDE